MAEERIFTCDECGKRITDETDHVRRRLEHSAHVGSPSGARVSVARVDEDFCSLECARKHAAKSIDRAAERRDTIKAELKRGMSEETRRAVEGVPPVHKR